MRISMSENEKGPGGDAGPGAEREADYSAASS